MENKKIALVTGASSGIGREIAIHLAKQNFEVYVNYNESETGAKETCEQILKNKGIATAIKGDITNEKEVIKMFLQIKKTYGYLDVLINNAGIFRSDLIEKHSTEKWERIMEVNLKGKMLCTKYAVPLLKKTKSSVIINIASRAGSEAMEESSAYCCAASGIIMLSKISALELSKYGIRVNTISPGLTKTRMTKNDSPQDFKDYVENNPLKRIGTTKDIALAVSFLVSEEASFVNGENLNVSGGILLK